MTDRAVRLAAGRRQAGAACVALACVMFTVSTWASPASGASSQAITSAGPLSKIAISDSLNCSVNHTADEAHQFHAETACGTFVAVGDQIYGPPSLPAGASLTGASNFAAFTPVSQSSVTGSGTAADPFQIVTVVDAGTTGVRVTETDRYVVGQETYRTDVKVESSRQATIVLYRAGDCYLQNPDTGFGAVDQATGAVSCVGVTTVGDDEVPSSRIQQWHPLSPGSNHIEANYDEVWSAIASGQPFPNTCRCDENIDNGAGLSWSATVPAGGSITRSNLTAFSPAGREPLTVTKTADAGSVSSRGANGYTITIANPNSTQVSLPTVYDALPSGFAYTAGSTTGVTTADPSVSGQTLTWTGPFTIPADGRVSLHFGVTASDTPGTYFNNAGADAGAFAVAPTGDTAPVTVTAATTTTSSTSTSTSTSSTSTTTSSTSTTVSTTSTLVSPTSSTASTSTSTTARSMSTSTTTATATASSTTSSSTTTTSSSSTTAPVSTSTTTTFTAAATTTTAPIAGTSTTVAAGGTSTTAPGAVTTTTAPTGASPTANLAGASVVAGEETTVFGGGFPGNAALTLEMHSDPVLLGSTSSDPVGNYSAVVKIPASAKPGVHEIVVSGGGAQARTSVTVAQPSSPKPLARTGSDTRVVLRVAAVAVGLGGLILLLAADEPKPIAGRAWRRRVF